MRAPSVCGGFGSKVHHYSEETMAAWAAMELERPVKWTATRTEGFLATSHGRDHRTHAELALDEGGRITGLRVDTRVGLGGYLSTAQAAVASGSYNEMLCGQYEIPTLYTQVTGLFANTARDAYAAEDLPADAEPGIEATTFFDPENYTFPFGTHIAVVEVDPGSGEITFERYIAVDDVGERINPKIVEGQIHGGSSRG